MHDSKSTNRYSLLQAVQSVLCRPYLNHLGKCYDILMIIYPGLLLKKFPHCYLHTYQLFQEAEIGIAATHNICTGSRINLHYILLTNTSRKEGQLTVVHCMLIKFTSYSKVICLFTCSPWPKLCINPSVILHTYLGEGIFRLQHRTCH